MSHSHSHHHSGACHAHPTSSNIRRLAWVLVLTFLYMIIEFIGGLVTNSLALLADAGHMLTDVAAVGLALFAAWFSEHPASAQRTYGYYRLEILAAFINGVALVAISLFILFEAYQRVTAPPGVEGEYLMWIASGGLVINLISAAILFQPGQKNMNVRGALMHVLSDSLGSLGVIIAGILMINFQIYLADPIISAIIALLVLINAWHLVKEATNVLLEAAPHHLSVADIKCALTDMPEIQAVHDLHVWSIASHKEAMSVHIVVEEEVHYRPELVAKIQHVLKERFGLTHLTIQLEPPGFEEDEIHF